MPKEPTLQELLEIIRCVPLGRNEGVWTLTAREIRALYEAGRQSVLTYPPKHDFWGAGEPDCPRDIKAGNGELHTLQCKACGAKDPTSEVCLGPDKGGGS